MQNARSRRKARHQVHEFLIDKESVGWVVEALPAKPARPPGQNLEGLRGCTNAKEAKIVDTRSHDASVVGKLLPFRWRQQMRGQDERGPTRQGVDNGRDGAEQFNIRIEIQAMGVAAVLQQSLKGERLY